MNDLRFAFRQLLKNPGFTAVAVLTLALGIGANSAIFSVVSGVLLRPLPYKEPDRIVTVLHEYSAPVAPADFLDWREQNRSFEILAAAEAWGGTLTGKDRPENIRGIRMGTGLMELLGVAPQIGRGFQADDYLPGHENVVVLSHGLWQRRFGGSPDIIGQSITLDSHSSTVIGVMPPSFRFAPFWATKSEMWAPLSLTERARERGSHSLRIFGRLKPGVTRQQAQADMETIWKRLEAAYPDTNAGRSIHVDALLDKVVGNIRTALLVLLGAVAFVMLIACVNVANLLLARAAAREKEMSIRAALGSSRWRIVRQLLTESLMLSCFGALLGLLIGSLGVGFLKEYLAGSANSYSVRLPRVGEIGMDAPTLLFTIGIAVLTGVVFGLVPALQAARPNLQGALQEGSRGSSAGRTSQRLRGLLVISEVALALVMLAGAGLLLRSFSRLSAIDPGFNPKNTLSMTVSLAGQDAFTGPKREAFYQALFQKIGAIPGVQSVSAINHLPLAGDQWGRGIYAEGHPLPAPGQGDGAVYRVCVPHYFSTMGMTLLRGRDFTERDRSQAPEVVVINEALARRQFGAEDPIGRRITMDDPRGTPEWLTVVGVVKDVRQGSWAEVPQNEFYLPWLQTDSYVTSTAGHFAYMTLVIRTGADPRSFVGAVQNAVWSLNADAPVSSVTTLEEVVSDAVWQQRFNVILIDLFAALALVLAVVGIYGVTAYSVTQRTREIGVRMALGAGRGDVVGMVVGQGARLALAGVTLGVVTALALTRLMRGLLYEVAPSDPATFVGVSLLLVVSALVACWLPARRAAKVDPMVALRAE
ncbi:MAG TPA: ABC transporter permease [Candidatus Limnocylindria bacterium]|nr:ABC transporter permease [Candidatus Limnocylindria bacterium]